MKSLNLETLLRSICKDVSIADIEMQLLQHHAWESLVADRINLPVSSETSVEDLRRAILDDLGTDRHLALNEVSVNLTLARRSGWSKFWFRLRHPFHKTNPDFRLTTPTESQRGIHLQVTFKRQPAGQWQQQSNIEQQDAIDLEFLT